ncbi:MAG: hypothetical protein SGPRY_009850, partial [Prymnesium sp.]
DADDIELLMEVVAMAGVALGVATASGAHHASLFVCLFLCYLSLFNLAQSWLSFQWDIFLLETGFAACLYAPWLSLTCPPAPSFPPPSAWLLRALWLKFMLFSGVVKTQSSCPTWQHLTALEYHLASTPLPTRAAWSLLSLPPTLLRLGVAYMFLCELIAPWLLLAPITAVRRVGVVVQLPLQMGIAISGNCAPCGIDSLSLLHVWDGTPDAMTIANRADEAFVRSMLSNTISPSSVGYLYSLASLSALAHALRAFDSKKKRGRGWAQLLTFFWRCTLGAITGFVYSKGEAKPCQEGEGERMGVREGECDRGEWVEIPLRYAPAQEWRPPRRTAPHQPRLDWQMWFAALGSYKQNPWLLHLMYKILQGNPNASQTSTFLPHQSRPSYASTPALQLLDLDAYPFHSAPPLRIRAFLYHYDLTRLPSPWASRTPDAPIVGRVEGGDNCTAWWSRVTGLELEPFILRQGWPTSIARPHGDSEACSYPPQAHQLLHPTICSSILFARRIGRPLREFVGLELHLPGVVSSTFIDGPQLLLSVAMLAPLGLRWCCRRRP